CCALRIVSVTYGFQTASLRRAARTQLVLTISANSLYNPHPSHSTRGGSVMCAAYLALALICTIPLFAQDKAATSEQKSETTAPEHKTQGELDVLSDTMGFDFSPYLNDVVQRVRRNWYRIIPESAHAPTMKKGNVSIEFAIMRDGTIRGMTLAGGLAGSAGDVALDRAAWRGITGSAPFPPLPDGSPGQYLALRMHFYYNPEKPIEGQAGIQGAAAYALAHGMKPIKDRTKVAIWMPSGSLRVAMGTSEHILAKVTGTTNTALKWSLSGPGCSGSACGTIVDGLYTAPSAVPSPPIVSVTATLECDRTATDSLPIRIVQPSRTAEGVLRVIDGRAKSQTASPTTDQKQPTPPSSTGPSSVGLCSHAPGAE